MSCLLPQFKCQPDTFCIQFRTPLSKIRGPVYFQTRCVLYTISAPTSSTSTLLDMEKLQISSLEAHSNPVSAQRRWTHMEAIGPPMEASFQATLARETLVTSDEAIIAAAAAEAVSFAKAAIKVAEDAKAMTTNNFLNGEKESKPIILSEMNAMQSNWVQQCIESEEMSELGVSVGAESEIREMEDLYLQYPTDESSCPEPTNEELTFLEQLSSAAAVRSTRQSERKARRARAIEKAATNVVQMVSTHKKKTSKTSRKGNSSDPFWHHNSAPKSKLLTSAEEKTLSEGIQDLLKLRRLEEELTARFEAEPTFAQLADAAGVDQRTLQQRLNYCVECKDKMLKSNIGLVISVAKNYLGAGFELQDLVSQGCAGLMKGAEKFDPSRGYKFSTYAHWWIRQTIRRSLTTQSRLIRLPFHMVGTGHKVREAAKKFHTDHGRDPTEEELAEESGLKVKNVRSILNAPGIPISLERKMEFGGFGESVKTADIYSDPDAKNPEEDAINQMMRLDLEKVLNTLNERERKVIRWRYGLEDGRMKALQEVGELMSISRERVRQIEACALRKLKGKKRRMEHLKSYLVVDLEDTGTF